MNEFYGFLIVILLSVIAVAVADIQRTLEQAHDPTTSNHQP